jgi:superfamily II DNA or RNA helicase
MIVEFDIYSKNKAIIKSKELIGVLRDRLSVIDKNAEFVQRKIGRKISPRVYAISPSGRFDIGMYSTIKGIIDELHINVEYKYSDAFIKTCLPRFKCYDKPLANLGLTPYDYQKDTVRKMLRYGRGCVLIGTGGGKTFIMALFAKTLMENSDNVKMLIIVPTLQLVSQTYDDFISYGIDPDMISKWTGSNKFNDNHIVIANSGILQSKSSDLGFLKHINTLLIDEVHILKKDNGINNIVNQIPTPNRFGFTGTLPEETVDIWNIYGKIGSILYNKSSKSLRDGEFISEAEIIILQIDYDIDSLAELHTLMDNNPNKYIVELEFTIEHEYRNKIISTIASKSNKNVLIMVDRIIHGELLAEILSNMNIDKEVHFICGDVDVADREVVREIMEANDNVICIAISKIFSTGINIKNIHNIIFATPGKAKVKLIQSIGRGLRLHENKDILKVIDISDNLHYANKHMRKREDLYNSEKLNYEIRRIKTKKIK